MITMRAAAVVAMMAATLATGAGVARADVPVVVTDIPPVESLVAQVMGDLGKPMVLTGKGADPHDFQLRPSQAVALSKADLVFWIGPELTPWLERALGGAGAASRAVSLLHAQGTFTMEFAPGQGDPGAAHDAGAGQDGHGHAGLNPHVWLDPANAKVWLGLIAADLSKEDPGHAAQYAANAKTAAEAIDRADAEAKAILAPVGKAPVVFFHDAFGYFARHYGLNVAGSVALGDAATPGAKRLSDIHRMLNRTGTACVFPEANHDPRLVETVVQGTSAKIGAPLDPAGTTLPEGADLYERLIKGLADKVAACAG